MAVEREIGKFDLLNCTIIYPGSFTVYTPVGCLFSALS
jgi:hypothetical protein